MKKNEIDIKDTIRADYEVPVSEFDGEFTKTTIFLLPILDICITDHNVRSYFVNSFINDSEFRHDFVRPIFVLLRTKSFNDVGYRRLANSLRQKENFLVSYDCGTKDNQCYVMYVFSCPARFVDDYYKFKKGNYSGFSKECKKKFPEVTISAQGKHIKSIAHAVIHKTDFAKEQLKKSMMMNDDEVREIPEWWSIPRREREYYRYKKETNEKSTAEGSGYAEESLLY